MHDDLLIPILVAILAGHAEPQRAADPLHGQSAATRRQDETACSQRARSPSGSDPARLTVVVPISSRPVTVSGSPAKAMPAAAPLHAAGLRGASYRARKTCLDGHGYNVN